MSGNVACAALFFPAISLALLPLSRRRLAASTFRDTDLFLLHTRACSFHKQHRLRWKASMQLPWWLDSPTLLLAAPLPHPKVAAISCVKTVRAHMDLTLLGTAVCVVCVACVVEHAHTSRSILRRSQSGSQHRTKVSGGVSPTCQLADTSHSASRECN